MSRVAAVVLAAGAATRFGGPKQELLLPEVLRRLESSPVDEIMVVDHGRVIQRGTEAGLLAVDGPFRRLAHDLRSVG